MIRNAEDVYNLVGSMFNSRLKSGVGGLILVNSSNRKLAGEMCITLGMNLASILETDITTIDFTVLGRENSISILNNHNSSDYLFTNELLTKRDFLTDTGVFLAHVRSLLADSSNDIVCINGMFPLDRGRDTEILRDLLSALYNICIEMHGYVLISCTFKSRVIDTIVISDMLVIDVYEKKSLASRLGITKRLMIANCSNEGRFTNFKFALDKRNNILKVMKLIDC